MRSPGKRGRLRGLALRLPTADSLCDLKVARASKISGRKFSAAARRKRTAFKSAEMAALKMQRGGGRRFLLAALHSVAKRVSRGQAYHPTRSVPVCPETAPHASAATIRSFVPDSEPSRCVPEGGKDRKTRCSGSCRALEPCTLLPAAANGDVPCSPARGDRAVPVGAPSEG